MSGTNREPPGIEVPGPLDRAFAKDHDDRIDILEGEERRTSPGYR